MSRSRTLRRSFFLPIASFFFVLLISASAISQSGSMDFGGGGFGADEPEIDVAAFLSVSAVAPGNTYPAAVTVEIPDPWHINSAFPRDEYLIPLEVKFQPTPGLTPENIRYPEAENLFLAGDTMAVYSHEVVVYFDLAVAPGVTESDLTLPISVTYQPCNDTECRAPKTVSLALKVPVGKEIIPAHAELFTDDRAKNIASAEPPAAARNLPVEEENDLSRLVNRHGFWGYLLALGLAFVTGLVLSFSPCTYPMIPITVSIFAGRQRSIGRGFLLSLIYVSSMAFVYGIMGLIVSLVGGVFGAWLASPPVVIAIVVIFIVFALSMFGLYEVQVPMALRSKLGAKAAGGGGVGSVMLLGVVAALVVSPCVGPFVAGILIYVATSGSPVIGFLVLFVFALGLGALYMLIGTFSSAISRLPGSGDWMESVKKFFGFVLLLMALYFVRTLIEPWLTALLAALLLLAFGVFGGGLDRLTARSSFFPRLKKFLGILAFILGVYLLLGVLFSQGMLLPAASQWFPAVGSPVGVTQEHLIDWETDLDTGLALARREGKPVVIDTWATWCANCRVLDKETFGNPAVAAFITENFIPVKVQLENADTDITRDFMARFGMSHYSLPTTLLLAPDGSVQRVLRGVVGPDDMLAELARLSS